MKSFQKIDFILFWDVPCFSLSTLVCQAFFLSDFAAFLLFFLSTSNGWTNSTKKFTWMNFKLLLRLLILTSNGQFTQPEIYRPVCIGRLHSPTCTAQHAQPNMHSPTCTAQHAQCNMHSATCTAQHAQPNMHSPTCTARPLVQPWTNLS